jgi:hypothetical protein
MNLFWRIVFWSLTIGLGFVNPVITFVMVLLYYLPNIICDICKECNHSAFRTNANKAQKEYSEDVLEEFR